ncbi:MAG TPA: CHAT domain-containing protein [Gemmatimonadales bacterium]|nr:CHAT domain-containing protein [Gemmatimonadales bacterium]
MGALLFLSLLTPAGPPPESPRLVVQEATRAVERGTVPATRHRWQARLAHDSLDAAAWLGLASLSRLAYDYSGADTLYARIAALPPARARGYQTFGVLGLAQARFTTGRYAEAGAGFDQARRLAEATNDSTATAFVLIAQGWLRLRSGNPALAGAVLDTAAALAHREDFQLRAAVACGRAAVHVRISRSQAMAEGRTGADLARRAGDHRLEANCLNGVANSLVQSGQLAAAARALVDVADRLRRLHERAGLASALQWSGFVAVSRDRFDEAQRFLGQAILEAEASGNRSALAWSLLDLGRVSLVFGDPASARLQTDRALAEMRGIGDEWGITNALGADGQIADLAGDTAQAHVVFSEQAARAAATGDAALEVDMTNQLASLAIRQRSWADAERYLDQARAASVRAGRPPDFVAQSYERGVLALRRGQLHQARALLSAALEAPDSSSQITHYLAGLHLAETALAQGDTGQAEDLLDRAADGLDAWRAGLSDSSLRVFAFQVLDEFGGPDLGTASIVAAVAARGRVQQALRLVERRRARELRDQLLRATAAGTTAAGTTAAGATANGATANGATPPSGKHPATAPAASFTGADFQARLPGQGTAVLEYATGRGPQPTTLFVITRTEVRAFALPPLDSLLPSIERFIAAIQGETPDSALSDRLGAILLGPAVRVLSPTVTRLVLVPDDALHRVPFPALRVQGRYAVERFALSQAPSAAVAADLWGRSPHAGPRRVLAFGDPAFPKDDPGLPPATRAHFAAFAQRGGLPQLPASAAEARSAASLFPGSEIRLGREASAFALRRARLSEFSILHLATHALVDEAALGRSAIVLAAGGGDDGFLGAGDLAQLRLDADLVVLSGCGTALGVIVGGEGIRGLTAPLLQAGARSVVGTLWPIADRSAADFVASFYGALGTGATTMDALRSAQLERLRNGVAPRGWAGFLVVGNGFLAPGGRQAGPVSAR